MSYYWYCAHEECGHYLKGKGCAHAPEADGKCQLYYPIEKYYRLLGTTDKALIEHIYKVLDERTPGWTQGELDCVHEIICRYQEMLTLTTKRTRARHDLEQIDCGKN